MKKGLFKLIAIFTACLTLGSAVACGADDEKSKSSKSESSGSSPVSSESSEIVEEESDVPATSIEVAADMGNGWNLGNTMEAVANWLGDNPTPYAFEQAWGQPVTTKECIEGIKAAGFNSVRIPVAWSNMMSDDGTYTIDPAYIQRVDEIIGYVLDADMYAVVNIHWDNGWWKDFGSSDAAVSEAAMAKYTAIWTQLSEHYKDYSLKLILESANEELGGSLGENLSDDQRYTLTHDINQKFVDIVRASGSKNAERFLLIAGFNTDINNTCDDRYVMPTDTIENHLLISVHYYTPSTYCIASETNNSWGYKESWGTDADKAEMRSYFEKMKKFTDAGYGVVIGEYGVTEIKVDGKNVLKPGAEDFAISVMTIAEEFGYCPMLWDTGAWYDRTGCLMKTPAVADYLAQ